MPTVIAIAALTLFLFAFQHTLRRCGPWVLWIGFGVLPAALTGYWIAVNLFDAFLWIKLYSVLFCVCYGTAVRDTALGRRNWARGLITALLALNILEAVAVDCLAGGLAHVLNAAAGLVLVAVLPRRADAVQVVASAHGRDVLQRGTPLPWVVGYTVWNWGFVYLNYPDIAGHHVAVLLSCVIVALIDSRLWLQARACTLGLHLMAMFTFPELVRSDLSTSSWSDPGAGLAAALAALGVAVGVLVLRVVTGNHLAPSQTGEE